MRKISEIITDIEKLYANYKFAEKRLDSYKDALKHHHEIITKETDDNKLVLLGMLLHYRKNPKYTWLKEEFNDELEGIGRLHQAKKIDKHVVKFINVIVENEDGTIEYKPLSSLALEPERYVRPYPRRRTKDIVEAEKTNLYDLYEELKKGEVEDVITEFKVHKLDYTQMDTQYQTLRTELLEAMQEENCYEVGTTIGSFKIMDKDPEYDLTALFGKEFQKLLEYSIRPLKGEIEIIDHFSKESILTSEDDFILDDHSFSFTDEGILIDNVLVSSMTKEEMLSLEEKLKESEFDYLTLRGVVIIDSDTLLRQLPFSSTKVEKMIDKGDLHPTALNKFRFVEKEEDMRTNFEVVEETTHNSRVEMFLDTHMRRAQKLRYMQENAKDVLNSL